MKSKVKQSVTTQGEVATQVNNVPSFNAEFLEYQKFLAWQAQMKMNPEAKASTIQAIDEMVNITVVPTVKEQTKKPAKVAKVKAEKPAKEVIELQVRKAGTKSVIFYGKRANEVLMAYSAKYPDRWTLKTEDGFQVGQSKQKSVLAFIASLNK